MTHRTTEFPRVPTVTATRSIAPSLTADDTPLPDLRQAYRRAERVADLLSAAGSYAAFLTGFGVFFAFALFLPLTFLTGSLAVASFGATWMAGLVLTARLMLPQALARQEALNAAILARIDTAATSTAATPTPATPKRLGDLLRPAPATDDNARAALGTAAMAEMMAHTPPSSPLRH